MQINILQLPLTTNLTSHVLHTDIIITISFQLQSLVSILVTERKRKAKYTAYTQFKKHLTPYLKCIQ